MLMTVTMVMTFVIVVMAVTVVMAVVVVIMAVHMIMVVTVVMVIMAVIVIMLMTVAVAVVMVMAVIMVMADVVSVLMMLVRMGVYVQTLLFLSADCHFQMGSADLFKGHSGNTQGIQSVNHGGRIGIEFQQGCGEHISGRPHVTFKI